MSRDAFSCRLKISLRGFVVIGGMISFAMSSGLAQSTKHWAQGNPPTAKALTAPSSWIDVRDRDTAWALYVYAAHDGMDAPYVWTGSLNPVNPGTVNHAFVFAELGSLNYYRMALGVAPIQTINAVYSAKAQAAALIMAAQRALSHAPLPSWAGYTQAGYEGASNSNLTLLTGRDAIYSYIIEHGEPNRGVGHRRWMLSPALGAVGFGDVSFPSGVTHSMGNALWVVDQSGTRLTRDGFVAWPNGQTPYMEIPRMWSFQMADADFTGASVSGLRG